MGFTTGTRLDIFEIVDLYPGPVEKHLVSTEGGNQPIWSANGRELFFRSNNDSFVAVIVTSFKPFKTDTPRLVFQKGYGSTTPVRDWDASRDGQRFLTRRIEESKDKPVTDLQIVLNWDEELQRRVPAK